MARSERNENFPDALEAVFLVVILFALEMLWAAVFRDVESLFGVPRSDLGDIVLVLANGTLFTALLYFKRLSYRNLFHSGRYSAAATLATLAVPILLIVPGTLFAVGLLRALLLHGFPMFQWHSLGPDDVLPHRIEVAVGGCLLAPVLEEMLFRGIILRGFLQQYSAARSITISALLFGVAHLNPDQFIVGVVLGLVNGWLYERTRSLWPCILLHGSYNIVVLYLQLTGGIESPVSWLVVALIGAWAGTRRLRALVSSPAWKFSRQA
jgi:membrane protease YdiL (CAAX protease family)